MNAKDFLKDKGVSEYSTVGQRIQYVGDEWGQGSEQPVLVTKLLDEYASQFSKPLPSENSGMDAIKEQCRLYAESCMYSKSWDRKDAEMVGVFYKFFIDKLVELTSSPLTEGKAVDVWVEIPVSERLPERWSKNTNLSITVTGFCSGIRIECWYDFVNNIWTDGKRMIDVTHWLEKHSSPVQGYGWISCEDRKPNLIEGKDCSENVLAICNGRLSVMAYCYIHADENSGYVWCTCNGDINGDAEFDDDYIVTHWQPLPPNPAG